MKKLYLILILLCFILIGSFLRFFQFTINPPSLNIDEVSIGYSAFSILKTGKDENGVFMPMFFASTGDYKNPVLIYSIVPSIALFGLNEFSVRLSTALVGVLSIPVIYMLVVVLIGSQRIALFSSLILALSPWHIFYSRYASDSLMATFITMIGVYSLLRLIKKNGYVWVIVSPFMLALPMYTYHSQRLFIIMFLTTLFFTNYRLFKKKKLFYSLVLFVILTIPLVLFSIVGNAGKRATMVFLSQDIEYTRNIILDHLVRGVSLDGFMNLLLKPLTIFSHENFLLFLFWLKRYLSYFQPDFLFFSGLNMTQNVTAGIGVLYFFEFPWLVLGLYRLIKEKIPCKWLIFLWILLGIFPASLANNQQSSVRTLLILPALILIIALGLDLFIQLILKIKQNFLRVSVFLMYSCFVLLTFLQTYLVFSIHFPLQKSEAFMYGTKESVLYALENKEKYREIVFDPYRGIDAQNIVNIPHMYILFYSKYDPLKYQTERKQFGSEYFSFDKFTIRPIDLRGDISKKNTLFIGSPWSLPEKDLNQKSIIKRIYLLNGSLALLIVSL